MVASLGLCANFKRQLRWGNICEHSQYNNHSLAGMVGSGVMWFTSVQSEILLFIRCHGGVTVGVEFYKRDNSFWKWMGLWDGYDRI